MSRNRKKGNEINNVLQNEKLDDEMKSLRCLQKKKQTKIWEDNFVQYTLAVSNNKIENILH